MKDNPSKPNYLFGYFLPGLLLIVLAFAVGIQKNLSAYAEDPADNVKNESSKGLLLRRDVRYE